MSKKKSTSTKPSNSRWKHMKGTEPILDFQKWMCSSMIYTFAKCMLFVFIPYLLIQLYFSINPTSTLILLFIYLSTVIYLPRRTGYYQCKCCGYRFMINNARKNQCPHCETEISESVVIKQDIPDNTKPKLSSKTWKKLSSVFFVSLIIELIILITFGIVVLFIDLQSLNMALVLTGLLIMTLPLLILNKIAGYYECQHCGYRFKGLRAACPNCEKSIKDND